MRITYDTAWNKKSSMVYVTLYKKAGYGLGGFLALVLL